MDKSDLYLGNKHLSLVIKQLQSTSWGHCRLGNRHRRRTPDSEGHILGEARPHSQLWLGLIPHTLWRWRLHLHYRIPLLLKDALLSQRLSAEICPAAGHGRLFSIIIWSCPEPSPGALRHSRASAPSSTALYLLRTLSRSRPNVALGMSPPCRLPSIIQSTASSSITAFTTP